jgi:hypothetical protein
MPVRPALQRRNASKLQAVDCLIKKIQAFATDMALDTAKNKVFS